MATTGKWKKYSGIAFSHRFSVIFLQTTRNLLVERYAWFLLLFTLGISFLLSDKVLVNRLYQLFVLLPLVITLRKDDAIAFWKNKAARLFVLLAVWQSLTLFWDGIGERDDSLFFRILGTTSLFYLVFLIARFQPSRLEIVSQAYLSLGIIWVVLIVLEWDGVLFQFQYTRGPKFGVFDNTIFVGWMLSTVGLVALGRSMYAHTTVSRLCLFISAVLIAELIYLQQSRSGYVFYAAGVACLLLMSPKKTFDWVLVFGVLVAVGASFFWSDAILSTRDRVLSRGMLSRVEIWHTGVISSTESLGSFLWGHGSSADPKFTTTTAVYEHFHNIYINHWYYSGFIGAILLFSFIRETFLRGTTTQLGHLYSAVVVGAMSAFLFDGARIFTRISVFSICFIFPLAMMVFTPNGKEMSKLTTQIKQDLMRKLFLISFALMLIYVVGDLSSRVRQNSGSLDAGKDMTFPKNAEGVFINNYRADMFSVRIESWPNENGVHVPFILTDVVTPAASRSECERANVLFLEGIAYTRKLMREHRTISLQNIRRVPGGNGIRYNALVKIGDLNLQDLLLENGFVVSRGVEHDWCADIKKTE